MMRDQVLFPDPKFLWKELLGVSLLAMLVLAFSVFCGILIGASNGGVGGALFATSIAIGANLLWLIPVYLWIPLYVKSLRYEIQEDEVIVHVGVLTKSVKHVPYRTVTNLHVKRGPLDRLFGLGTVDIQTAGISGDKGAEESLVGLLNYSSVYENVATQIRRFRTAMEPTMASEGAPLEADAPWHELLQEVRQIHQLLESRIS
jgi:membrane protein YdbS with pleckstrin-like domain